MKKRGRNMGKQGIVKEGVLITCAMLIVSAAVYFFLVPSKIVVGSISGLAMVLAELLHMQMSTITFILNVVLLMAGFLFIGKEFGAKTIYTSLLLPVFLWIFLSGSFRLRNRSREQCLRSGLVHTDYCPGTGNFI